MNKDNEKKAAGIEAAALIRDGMVVGLGTGSTVRYFIEKLSERVRDDSLEVIGIPSSIASEKLARELGLKISGLDEHPVIDHTVDGADEVDPQFNMIKGGGGAHLREKVIAEAAKRYTVIVDQAKIVERLGGPRGFPVPVEVLPFAKAFVSGRIRSFGGDPVERTGFVTDNGNIVLDVSMDIDDPGRLEAEFNNIPGVLENGIFSWRRPEKVIVGISESDGETKIRIMERD